MSNGNPYPNPSPYSYPTPNWPGFGPHDTRALPQGGPLSPEQFGPGGQFTPQVMPQGWQDTRALPQGGPPPFVPPELQDTRGLLNSFLDYLKHQQPHTRGLSQGAPPSSGEPGNDPNASQQGAGGAPPGGPLPPLGASSAGAQGSPMGAQGTPTGAPEASVGAQGTPTGAPGPSAAGPLSPEEKAALQSTLAILKEGREAIAKNQFNGLSGYRSLAACAYLSGFLEAKGMEEVGQFVKSIPPAKAGGAGGAQDYDQLIQGVESMLSDEPATRGKGKAIGKILAKVPWEKVGRVAVDAIGGLFDD